MHYPTPPYYNADELVLWKRTYPNGDTIIEGRTLDYSRACDLYRSIEADVHREVAEDISPYCPYDPRRDNEHHLRYYDWEEKHAYDEETLFIPLYDAREAEV